MTPSFKDAHNAINWSETIFQEKSMLQAWSNKLQTLPTGRFLDFHDHTRTLTFNIVSRGSFGVRMPYPVSDSKESSNGGRAINSTKLQGRHNMIFSAVTLTVVDGLKWLFIFPRWFLSTSP